MLALTFSDPADYDKIRQDDFLSITDFSAMKPGSPLTLRLDHADGTSEEIKLLHTYNSQQIEWVAAGSALNKIRKELQN